MSSPAGSPLTTYRNTLQVLDDQSPLTAEKALEILCAREALQHVLTNRAIAPSGLKKISELDTKLRENSHRLMQSLDAETLSTYRNSLLKQPDSWWWYLDQQQPPHPLDRYDWVFNGLSFASWAASVALLINIASRFFSGGPDVAGAVAVILPTLLALLQARSTLTETGQQGFDGLLKRLRIPTFLEAETKFAFIFLFFVTMLLFWATLPEISECYGRWGTNYYNVGDLGGAESRYKRAIALDPDNAHAHYNLGVIYEEWQQLDEAKKEYQVAVGKENVRAYNNLARLYIQDKKYPAAASLLTRAQLQLVPQQVARQASLPKDQQLIFPVDQYSLAKNLGWVRFEQNRDQEAEAALNQAIQIATDPTMLQPFPKQASAHCILAQVLTRQRKPGAIGQWQQCKQLGNPEVAEEDAWMNLADQALKPSNNQAP